MNAREDIARAVLRSTCEAGTAPGWCVRVTTTVAQTMASRLRHCRRADGTFDERALQALVEELEGERTHV